MTGSIGILRNCLLGATLFAFLATGAGCKKSPPAAESAPVDNTPEIFVALGHSGAVTSLSISPDARYALSGSEDHTVKLWDLQARKLVRTWQGKTLGIRGDEPITAEFSPDGKRFLAGSWDGDIVVIELATGRRIASFEDPAMAFAAFSPNGEYLLTGNFDGKARLWGIPDQEEAQSYELSSHGVTAGAFQRTGSLVACGDGGGNVHLLDLEKEELVATMSGEGGRVFAVEFSPDGTRLTSVNSAGTVATWDVRTRTKLSEFSSGVTLAAPSVAFSHDGRFVVAQGTPIGEMPLWNIDTGERIKILGQPAGFVKALAFSPDGSILLAGALDNGIDIFDVAKAERRFTFPGLTRHAKGIAASPDGTTLLSASVEWFSAGNITISRWDASHGLLKKQIAVPATFDIAFSPDLGSAYSLRTNWNAETGEKTGGVAGDWEAEISVYSPDGDRVLTGDLQGNVRLVDPATGRQLLAMKAHEDQLGALAFSRDGRFFATGSRTNSDNLKVWNAQDGSLVRAFSQNTEFISAIAFLPDGRHILTGNPSRDAIMRLWDISTGEVVREFTGHTNDINAIAVSNDGTFAVSGGTDTQVKMWNIATGEELKTFTGHADDIQALAVSQDGRRIASVSDDGTTRLWGVDRGVEIAKFVGFEDGEWVVMTPEGYFNASPRGGTHLNVRLGTDVYSVDNFFETFFDPVRVASVLGGGEVETAARPDIRKGVLPPPSVRILSPGPNTSRTSDSVTVAVSAIDMGGGVDEIRLYHNGKAIGEDARGMRPIVRANETVRTYVPTLVEGVNIFRAVAYSKDRTESHAAEVTVMLEAPRQETSLHVLTVGINEYKNRALNLNFARPDAEAIAAFFRRSGGRLFKSANIREVYDDQATKAGILAAIGGLRTSRPQDAVVVYLAGHGESLGERWYFLPHELTRPEREDDVRAGGISSDELRGAMKEVKAQKVLLLIDACKAGAMLVAFRGFEDRKALSQLSRAAGVHIVAASTKDQFAAEVKDLGHGVFTYTLLAGLNGQAARSNEPVTVRKLMGYIEETLPGLTKKYKQEAQYPVVDSRGMDFPLVPGR
jgi:WD40 repeat protein